MLPSAPASTLTIRVLLFASYAELLGQNAIELRVEGPAKVGDAIDRLRSLPGGDRLPQRPLCAVNLLQATAGDVLCDGDELAVLPPVSGG